MSDFFGTPGVCRAGCLNCVLFHGIGPSLVLTSFAARMMRRYHHGVAENIESRSTHEELDGRAAAAMRTTGDVAMPNEQPVWAIP